MSKTATERKRSADVPWTTTVGRFFSRFAPAAEFLGSADAASRYGLEARLADPNANTLERLGLPDVPDIGQLADIVAYDPIRNWLLLIRVDEASDRGTPFGDQRVREAVTNCAAARVYVTAVATKRDFRRRAADIVWNTVVWIAEEPNHLVHFDGGRLFGPHEKDLTASDSAG